VLRGSRPDAATTAPAVLALVDELQSDRAALARRASVRRNARPARAAAAAAEVQADPGFGPAPYVRFDDVLSRRDHRRLLRFALSHVDGYQQSGLSGPEGAVFDDSYRRSQTYFDVSPEMAVVSDVVRSLLPYLRAELGIPWFSPLKYEVQLHTHRHGDFFRAHPDCVPSDNPKRRLSAVYYFYEEPRPFRGGELSLYDRRQTDEGVQQLASATVVDPLNNSLVAFASDLTHEVSPVMALGDVDTARPLRHSVSVWVYEDPSPETPTKVSGTLSQRLRGQAEHSR
jgi:Rps23 Pro-64 3,4-dihydroxylase Tpa1-like proline 4-hydroxylase